MSRSEFMEQFVHDLIERYEADVLPSGLLYLELRRKGHGVLIVEETVKQQEMHVRYQLYDAEGKPMPEPEVVFRIAPDGHWIPFAIHRISAGWHTFADLDMCRGELIITDPKNQASLAYFADFWAEVLRSSRLGTIRHQVSRRAAAAHRTGRCTADTSRHSRAMGSGR